MIKKSLVALAVLGVAGMASAQSSVTLFGVLDTGVSYYDGKTAGGAKTSKWVQSTSGLNSSRIGFRGTEDLGAGMAASFWIEAGVANDTGSVGGGSATGGNASGVPNTATAFFNRRSTVSLSGGFGEVRIGRDYTATFLNDSVFDPFGTDGGGTNHILMTRVLTDLNAVRASNMVGYFLPGNLGGFYGQAQANFHENVKTSGVTVSKAGRYIAGRFGYANGPLDVAAAYGQSTTFDLPVCPTTAACLNQSKQKIFNLGASYDLGMIKPMAEFSQVKIFDDSFSPFKADVSTRRRGLTAGFTAPVGAGLIRASYSYVKDTVNPNTTYYGSDLKSMKLALGYVHNLSKRTALYATYAHIKNQNGADYTVSIPSGIAAPSFAATRTSGAMSSTSNGMDFGVRHSF